MSSNKGSVKKMNNVVEQIQQATKDQGDAAMASAQTLATSLQTIATAHADYAKRAMQDASEFISKLTSLKEPTKVVELQSGHDALRLEPDLLAEHCVSDAIARPITSLGSRGFVPGQMYGGLFNFAQRLRTPAGISALALLKLCHFFCIRRLPHPPPPQT